MYINLETDYAIRIVCTLAGTDEIIDAKTISEEATVTLRFSLKILRKLVGSGLVKSYKGSKGGYALNKDADDISLKDIIEIIEGPLLINRCLHEDGCCNRDLCGMCSVQNAFSNVSASLSSELDKHTIADLIAAT